jgi:hypothetical protein
MTTAAGRLVRWSELEAEAPELAAAGRVLLYASGDGMGYLATIRSDGGPRIHPVSPFIAAGGLHVMLIDSPKRSDLYRDPRYALHSAAGELRDEFTLLGEATAVDDPRERGAVEADLGDPVPEGNDLFALRIGRAHLATYDGTGEWHPPFHVRWP